MHPSLQAVFGDVILSFLGKEIGKHARRTQNNEQWIIQLMKLVDWIDENIFNLGICLQATTKLCLSPISFCSFLIKATKSDTMMDTQALMPFSLKPETRIENYMIRVCFSPHSWSSQTLFPILSRRQCLMFSWTSSVFWINLQYHSN